MRSEGEGDLDGWRQIVSWPYPPTSVTNLLTARRKPVTNVSRIAWIVGVGASRGLGAASARRFAREGYKVAVTGRSSDALQVIVDEIVAAGGQAIPAAGDAQQEAGMVDILDLCLSQIKSEHIGGAARPGPAAKNGPGQFDGARDRRILLQR